MAQYRYRYLRGRMHALGMNSEDLANALGMASNTLSHRMTGRTPWTVDEMYEVLRVCDAPAEELHLYFPKNGMESAGSAPITRTAPRDAADEAAEYLSGFIRCVLKGGPT